MTIQDAPGEEATRAEADAWAKDLAEARSARNEAWGTLSAALAEGRVDLTGDDRAHLGEVFAPLWARIYPPEDAQGGDEA